MCVFSGGRVRDWIEHLSEISVAGAVALDKGKR